MSVLSSNNLSLIDIARQFGPDSKELKLAEILTQKNAILEDMPFIECNNGMVNIGAVRTGLPSGTWRKLYGGVAPEKSTTKQVSDTCGMLESFSEPDAALINMAPNKAIALLREGKAFISGMSKTMASAVFYGDSVTSPEKIEGLSSRYNAYGTDEDESSFNVLNAGGNGSYLTSIFAIAWGDDTMFGLYPKGSKAGLQQNDLGEQTTTLADGKKYRVYQTHYKWDCGLAVLDWRYCVRIANIDVTSLVSAGDSGYSGPNLIGLLTDAMYRFPDDAANIIIYANRTVSAALTKLAVVKGNLALGIDEFAGKKITHFWGHAIKRCDAILGTESHIPAAV